MFLYSWTEIRMRKPMPDTPSKPIILLADDDEVIRNMGRDILHILGYDVLLANDGEDTVHVYKQHQDKIAVVILDWHMPGLSGMEILQKLWSINKDVKVVVATGLGMPREMESEKISSHQVSLLQKPYLVRDLQNELARLLDRKDG
jgi:CheY-like chemotaxis protein